MSIKIIEDIRNAEHENTEMPFSVELIHVLVASKGIISQIFSEIDPNFVLKLLYKMGEDDAKAYQKKDRKRISAYITSKNPSLKFKKVMNEEAPCRELLMCWFMSNLVKEGLISARLSLDDLDHNFGEKLAVSIKLTEKLLSQDDLLRSYIALGCLLCMSSVQNQFSDEEVSDYLRLYSDISKDVLIDYLGKINIRVQEGTPSFLAMILKHEKEYESLAMKYEDAAKELRQCIIPQDALKDEVKQLVESLENLKILFRNKWLEQEGYILAKGETIDTLEDMKHILEKIDNRKKQKVTDDIEAAKKILKRAKSISISGLDMTDHPFTAFREKIDLLENQVSHDHSLVEALLSRKHTIAQLLRLVETGEKPTGEEIGPLLLNLKTFCGAEDSSNIIGNLMMGQITLVKADKPKEKKPKEEICPTTEITVESSEQNQKKTLVELGETESEKNLEADEKESAKEKGEPETARGGGFKAHGTNESVEGGGEKQEIPEAISSILPAHAYAKEMGTSLDHIGLENLLWALIYEDDLPGAYWLSRAIEFKHGECAVPPWMIMATQGSRWLASDSIAYVDNLLEIAKTHRPGRKSVEVILGLAASIRPSLIQPGCGLIDWLQKPEKYSPALIMLVETVKEFSKYGRAIMYEDVIGLADSQNLSARISEVAGEADRWLKEATKRKAKFRMATEVWKYLTGPKGEIHEYLQPVINNDKGKIQDVRENLSHWQKLDYVEEKIDDITKKLSRLRSREIVGSPRQQIIRNVEEACKYAYSWCQLIYREQEYGKKGNKLSEQIKALQKSIRECIPGLYESFRELTHNSEPAPLAAAFACLARSMKQVLRDLNIEATGNELTLGPDRQWHWLTQNARSLDDAIGRRLIMIPEYLFDHGINLKKEQHEEFLRIFCDVIAKNQSLEDIFTISIKKQDYRYAELLMQGFDEKKISELQIIYDSAINDSNYKLKDALASTGSNIEQALVDGVITEETHSEYNDKAQAVELSVELSNDLNYRGKYEILNGIKDKIYKQREQRLIELKDDWELLRGEMHKSSTVSSKKEQVMGFIQDALDRKDTRVVEECLAHLREVFDKGINLEESLFRTQKRSDYLAEFHDSVPKIKSWLESVKGLHEVAVAIDQGVSGGGINYGQLQRPRRDEAVRVVSAWRNLKRQKPNAKKLDDDIASVLLFMGFTLEFKDGIPPIQVQKTGQDWLFCTASMSAGDIAKPIPQFGSLTRNRYEIICLWERPGADTIAARLRELRLTFGSVIVFYLGRLYDRQRRDLVRISRDRTVSAVLLDEILLVYLTKERDAINRLPVFLRCSLPYTVLNPYTPFQAGDVPPEMFFGREEMIRELQKMGGSCIVYGGRQLGKSALLRSVQREFHNPSREQYAAVVDIKLLGDLKAMQQTSLIWGRIRDSLKTMGLLARNITTDRAEEIRRYIKDVMQKESKRKLILLFDEADNFLETDAKENFSEVEALRILMLESDYHFKIIFAGLQNVQRFQGIPNQPLAHFGTPIRVGPLEADAAQRLVSEPLEALGYRLEDDRTTVLRILSYTNYHPGLIQLFCQELVKRLEGLTGSMSPPFPIRQEDVEAVYRLDDVRNSIKERFDWTLALNSRYQAVAWLMVLDQIEKRDSYARAYPPGNILNIARDWWREGFGEIGLDELRGLLDEMCGLGVLVRNQEGHYRLRSPNLVRLLGTDEDILNNIEELVSKKAPLPFNADNYHVPLDVALSSYSPLTYFQERNLNKQHSGTSLIFSSEALGLTYLKNALNKFVPIDVGSSSGLFSEMPVEILCSGTMSGWLEKHVESNRKYENLIVYRRIYEADNTDMADCVSQAIHFCSRNLSRKRWLKIFFIFDPLATWKWVTLPEHVRKGIEDRTDASVYTRKWNLEGLKQRLAQRDKMHHENILTQTLQTTGGWPFLLDILFERCGKQDDIRPFLPRIESELSDPDSLLRKEFLAAIGIKDNAVATSILIYLKGFEDDEAVPVDLLSPDYIKSANAMTVNDCRNVIEYLVRMSCIDIQNEGVHLDPIVKIVLP